MARLVRLLVFLLFATALALPMWMSRPAQGQGGTEAPTGMDTLTNGMVTQAVHDGDRVTFEERDGVQKGLGPVYNAQSCAECHQNPVTGGISQISELRAGHNDDQDNFVPATLTINDGGGLPGVTIANRSLINQRATCPGVVTDPITHLVIYNHPNEQAQERVPGAETVRTRRMTTNLLGLGFVEALSNTTLQNIPNGQPNGMKGQVAFVPVAEANGALRVGRFGWKDQDASLLTFSGGAYLNEMGITNRLNTSEVTTLCDDVPDTTLCNDGSGRVCGEDPDNDIDAFAQFMRASKAVARDARLAATADAHTGAALFHSVGCDICHIATLTTAPAGTLINGGAFTVPPALGSKIFHPYSDFLLHDVGTGDGIAQVNNPNTGQLDQTMKNKMRTAPLWGVRTRNELMHDGENYTRNEAILRHANEANGVINNYRGLSTTQKNQLVTFLNSL
ncbi:MAG TPA: di-heme oxidoredictase family protein [Pyrinomonadaceae bacterium]|nr:di-heme oxidoredictase family protein [Pyrinomonadaceae bacterium]